MKRMHGHEGKASAMQFGAWGYDIIRILRMSRSNLVSLIYFFLYCFTLAESNINDCTINNTSTEVVVANIIGHGIRSNCGSCSNGGSNRETFFLSCGTLCIILGSLIVRFCS
ncbi:hypothetical protein BX600DRAFT_232077 [Xylariales sp. PMI_506]|nr:hypothetical protein BX600DRAFT_232077 [Xylariales sp. PMI_506]